MKKKLILIIAVLTAISLSACGNSMADMDMESSVTESSEITESIEEAVEDTSAPTSAEKVLTPNNYAENADAETLVLHSDNTQENKTELEFKDTEVFEDEEYDIFKHAKEHSTFEYGQDENGKTMYGVAKYAIFTMDNELRAAISDLIPELNDYPEAYRELQLKTIAREISWLDDGERLDTENIRETILYNLDIYEDAGYDKEYGPGPNTKTPSTEITTPGNNNGESTGNTGSTGGTTNQQPSSDVKWADTPTVTIDYGPILGTETFTHTGEYIDGKAIYTAGGNRRYHITESGETQLIPEELDTSMYDPNGSSMNWR